MILRRALAALLLALAFVAPALAGDTVSYESGGGLAANTVPKAGGIAGQLVVSAATDDGSTYTISGESLRLDSDVSPTALSGDVNDYNPTSLSTAITLRVDGGAANRNLTGLTGGASGRIVRLVNSGTTNNLVLKEQNASSSAANRFALGGLDITLGTSATIALQYDSTSSRWRPANWPGGTTTVSGQPCTLNAACTVPIPFFANIGLAANQTKYVTVSGDAVAQSNETSAQAPLPQAMTSISMRVVLSVDPGNTNTYVVTLRKNTGDTALTCTVTGNGSTGTKCNASSAVSFAIDDLIAWKVVSSASATSASVMISLLMQ